jgi:hypothetical protein
VFSSGVSDRKFCERYFGPEAIQLARLVEKHIDDTIDAVASTCRCLELVPPKQSFDLHADGSFGRLS